ncbi:hypothetical protein O6H91_04G018300 [Diphasiastrum complanatum]|uniref:Uncharacterized protein n=2 Tax=Diphasiastrum complanatum TaxID=34168 RepID=A0ACC2DUI3_DIPCM|nr:hypothetical protein O6H91_04G018200 [Diphasiastrum complanatum]KAJ7557957.1 hypothetical protein O6H91_04G018300 [Diphasiastrum complanatum]
MPRGGSTKCSRPVLQLQNGPNTECSLWSRKKSFSNQDQTNSGQSRPLAFLLNQAARAALIRQRGWKILVSRMGTCRKSHKKMCYPVQILNKWRVRTKCSFWKEQISIMQLYGARI